MSGQDRTLPQSRAVVLLIANNFPPVRGGSAVVYDNLARHAPDDILVLAPRQSYLDGLPMIGWREQDRRAPFRTRRLDLLRTLIRPDPREGVPRFGLWRQARFRLGDLRIRARLLRTVLGLVRHGGIRTVCVGELLSSGWLLVLLRRLVRLGLPLRLIAYVHGEEITTQDPYDPDHRRCRAALLAADRIVVVSRFTLGVVQALLGADAASRTCLIENGVDAARFSPGPGRPDLLQRYGLQGCFVFISVCGLLERKGLDQAIRAFARLLPAAPDACYLMVGAGPFEPELRRIAQEEGVADRVILAGQVTEDELVPHYRLGRVFVMPNREINAGTVEVGSAFLEANSCGLPVIAGRDGGSRDVVRDGETGLVVDGRSVDAIEVAMRRLYEDASLRRIIVEAGLRDAARREWESRSRRFLTLCGIGHVPDAA